MSAKLIVIAIIIVLFIVLIAIYARVINIDAVFRKHEKPIHPASVVIYDMPQQFTYGSTGGNFIIHDKKLRLYSSCIPPVVIRIILTKDGKQVLVSDDKGKTIILGSVTGKQLKDNSDYYTVGVETNDKITLNSSFSVIPYYYGSSLFLSGPLFRYYHYYLLHLEKASGASLLLEWKFSTYKGPDGKLVPDLFGDNKEGLVKIEINERR